MRPVPVAVELSVRIHEFGGGISQLIGTGGRDLSEKIGGLMMLDAIGMLEADPQTGDHRAYLQTSCASGGAQGAGTCARLS